MGDIELVIKIPEELKNKIDNANEDNYKTYIWWFETTLYCAIKNGIPLPKEHGDLKDVEKLKSAFIAWSMAVQGFFTDSDIASIIYNSPPIIKADKTESEDKLND